MKTNKLKELSVKYLFDDDGRIEYVYVYDNSNVNDTAWIGIYRPKYNDWCIDYNYYTETFGTFLQWHFAEYKSHIEYTLGTPINSN